MEIRKYECPDCHNKFWVDCDDTDYPAYCPFCGKETVHSDFIKSQRTDELDDRFPAGYVEVEYDNFENADAIDGARFDDLNFQRYYER